MRTSLTLTFAGAVFAAALGCGHHRDSALGGGDATGGGPDGKPADACVGLECRIVDCASQNMPNTTISGTVYAPNGTLPLFGVTVYVPNVDPPKFDEGVQCSQCTSGLPGDPIVSTTSDEKGNFKLDNVPTGSEIPLIITIGKWRKRVLIPTVSACQDTPLPATMTSLPRTQLEGEMPRIAITTGACDALECLARKLGIADNEFTTAGGLGRVHLYNGNGASQLANGDPIADAQTLWSNLDNLKKYDIVMMSCECSQEPGTKPQASMDNMKAYADLGGRVFGSHYHNIWIGGEYNNPSHAPAVWKDLATWNDGFANPTIDTIDQVDNPKGASFANWMLNVQGSTTLGQVPIQSGTGRQTALSADLAKTERWVYYDQGTQYPQMFQFTTPNELGEDQRCGKVVFSDMHVATDFSSGKFPSGCTSTTLTPQEKALAFMFFDIAACVVVIQ